MRGEAEQTREEMWQQPLSAADGYFSSSLTPVLLDAWLIGSLLALVTAMPSLVSPEVLKRCLRRYYLDVLHTSLRKIASEICLLF